MAFRRANKPTPYNTLGKKPKKFKQYRVLKDGTVQHWDKTANGNRGGWRPKRNKQCKGNNYVGIYKQINQSIRRYRMGG